MLSKEKFDFIKDKYGYWASWAIWALEGDKPKSNIGDLSVLEGNDFLTELNPNVILVGLNISRGSIKTPFANFHDTRPEATDYKIRYALQDSPYWGGYMTDIIKDYDQKFSGKVIEYLKENKEFEKQNVEFFYEEIKDLEANDPTIVAFGRDSYNILKKYFKSEYKILKVPHYANYSSKEKYRDEVKLTW